MKIDLFSELNNGARKRDGSTEVDERLGEIESVWEESAALVTPSRRIYQESNSCRVVIYIQTQSLPFLDISVIIARGNRSELSSPTHDDRSES